MIKKIEKKIGLIGLIIVLWVVFYLFFYNYYQDAVDFVTMGAKNEIQLLELFYYRGQFTVYVIISYFLLVSLNMLFYQILRVKSIFDQSFKLISIIALIVLVISVSISMFNILRVIFLLLLLISFTLNFIVYTISKSKYAYEDGEIVYVQGGFKNKEDAKKVMNTYIQEKEQFFRKNNYELFGEILNEENDTFKIELVVEKTD